MPDRPWSDPGHDIRGDLERARELALDPAPYEPTYYPCPLCRVAAVDIVGHLETTHPDEWAADLEAVRCARR